MKFNAPFEPEPPVKFAPVPPEFAKVCEWLIQQTDNYKRVLIERAIRYSAKHDSRVRQINDQFNVHMQTAARLLRWLETNQKQQQQTS